MKLILAILLSTLLIACATTKHSIYTTFDRPDTVKNIDSLLVIGLGIDSAQNEAYEKKIQDTLNTSAVKVYSYSVLSDRKLPVSKKTARELVTSNNIDAILVTRVSEIQKKVRALDQREEVSVVKIEPDSLEQVLVMHYKNTQTTEVQQELASVYLINNLFSGINGDLHWSALASIIDINDAELAADISVELLIKALKEDGIISEK